jgi:hypothetical protein
MRETKATIVGQRRNGRTRVRETKTRRKQDSETKNKTDGRE